MAALIGIAIGLGIIFLIEAGFVWLICWALNVIGIHTICGVNVEFSWPLAFAIIVIIFAVRGLFGAFGHNSHD
jgi:uncharacterized membrane protein (DUF485 family)